MKKILLGTTMMTAAALLSSGAMADSPKVTVGGFLDFQAGFVDQDAATGTRDYGFQNDTEIHFMVDGKADNGLGYGAVVELEADVSADGDGEGGNADKTYLFLDGTWGRVEMGANVGPTKTMKVDASTFARGTGGVDGDWYDFVSLGGAEIISPDLPSDHGAATAAGITGAAGLSEDATKVTYYSPRFSGFQFGVSFTPDAGDTGTAAGFTGDINGDAETVFGLGLNYTAQFDQVGLAASATGEWGEAEAVGGEDLGAWALGLNATFSGITVGGSWGDWGDSLLASGADAQFWDIGAAYDFGGFGASIGYLTSEVGSADFQNVSIGVDYELAPGLMPYAEVNFFDSDASANDGTVLLVGTQLTF